MTGIMDTLQDEETFLFTDTETTGFKKNGPLVQDGQARICQIAAILTDATGHRLAELNVIIKPDGWEVGAGAAKVNGLSNELCEKYGMNAVPAFKLFRKLASLATYTVAHNKNFDRDMLFIEEAHAQPSLEGLGGGDWLCTMEPNAGLVGGKSLKNCVRHYLNREPSNAHDAMGDTIDCMEIFFAMRGIEISSC